ncbi:MAG TPA: prolipoprotein diacylglyceryl transferase [Roseimicrobium sp.]|nr:prolipoprotein diacylglyceryl transferase [Roseimicrobium sp.]
MALATWLPALQKLLLLRSPHSKNRPVLAYYLHDLSPFIFEVKEGVGLRWYGLAYVLSFILAGLLYRWLARRGYTDLPAAQVSDFICWAAVFGVMIGGRVGWILFYGIWMKEPDRPWYWPFEVWGGGMSSHGGIIGLVLFTLYWSRKHKVSWTGSGDCLVVVAPIGLFLVRLANFVNGELYGRPAGEPGKTASVPWAMIFPKELPTTAVDKVTGMKDTVFSLDQIRHDEGVRTLLLEKLPPRHPSQLYEALLEGVILFAVLWILRTRFRVPRGVLTGAFFILYAMLRIVGEVFREPDSTWHVGPISAGQFLSIFMFFVGAAFIAFGMKRQDYERVFQQSSSSSS